jgi:osmotically-inducible protein OsmY
MNGNIRIKPDGELRELVLNRIRKQLDTASSAIDVATEGGVVTLMGSVNSLSDKIAAEKAAKGVNEVLVVADELAVRSAHEGTDTQIARDVLLRLQTHPGLPQDAIRATVTDGEVTLEGVVHWQLQKLTAESIIRNVKGVWRIRNLMEVQPARPCSVPAEELFPGHPR